MTKDEIRTLLEQAVQARKDLEVVNRIQVALHTRIKGYGGEHFEGSAAYHIGPLLDQMYVNYIRSGLPIETTDLLVSDLYEIINFPEQAWDRWKDMQ